MITTMISIVKITVSLCLSLSFSLSLFLSHYPSPPLSFSIFPLSHLLFLSFFLFFSCLFFLFSFFFPLSFFLFLLSSPFLSFPSLTFNPPTNLVRTWTHILADALLQWSQILFRSWEIGWKKLCCPRTPSYLNVTDENSKDRNRNINKYFEDKELKLKR